MMPATTDQDHVTSATHTVERLTVRLALPYTEAVARFGELVPPAPLEAFHAAESWDAVKAMLDATPFGFMVYGKIDPSALLRASGLTRPSIEYLVGNHVLAETMYRRDPAIALYAPLRITFHADDSGLAIFSIDRPSDLFGSFGDPQLAETGRVIDGKIAGILDALGVRPPASLVHESAA